MSQTSPWPEHPIPEPVKELILHFFSLADTKSEDSGARIAKDTFSSQGVLKNGPKSFTGHDEIIAWRRGAWDVFTSRKHTVLKVYTQSDKADDILLTGSLEASLTNGASATGHFCARVMVDGASTDSPKISLYEVWADQTPFVNAIKGGQQ